MLTTTSHISLKPRCAMSVSITAGQTALTRMPDFAYSMAAAFVNPITPCLVAKYGDPMCATDQACDRGHVHDRPAAVLQHLLELILHGQKHAGQVDGDDLSQVVSE